MIREAITNMVRANIAARLNSAISSTIESSLGAASGAAGVAKPWVNPDKKSKFSTEIMVYPSEIGDKQQGHYIVFSINEFSQGKLKSESTKKSFSASVDKIIAEEGGDEEEPSSVEDYDIRSSQNRPLRGEYKARSLVAQKPTRRIAASISLYMPPSVTAQYKVGYADSQIGALAMIGKDAYNSVAGGDGFETSLSKIVDSAASTGAEGLKMKGLGLVDVAAPGAKALVQLETGKVVTPKMELMFENVGRRDFSFTFNFIPKSAQEAKTIERIIHTFKLNMMPEFVVGSQREMKIPNTFDIQYMNQGVENTFINKISTCFLKGVDVTYGGDRFTAYDPVDGSPPPQKSSITLNFGEIEVMNKELIKRGF